MNLPEHEVALEQIDVLLDAANLNAFAARIRALVRPAIGLKTRPAAAADLANGVMRFGGQPDLPAGFTWPNEGDEPISFIAQVRLDQIARFDVEERLPHLGMLTLFTDSFCDHVSVHHFADVSGLIPTAAPDGVPSYPAAGVDARAELHLPPHSSAWIGLDAPAQWPGSAARMNSALALPKDDYERYWDAVWLPHRNRLRAGNTAGVDSVHQLLGYPSDSVDGPRADEEVLLAFDSDDLCEMSWGDVQCVWLLTSRAKLAAGDFSDLRVEV